MTRLCFAGPLPPPVNGFSAVCGMMLDLLKARMPVEVFNRAPNSGGRAIGVLQQLIGPLKYFATCIGKRDTALYLALSAAAANSSIRFTCWSASCFAGPFIFIITAMPILRLHRA